MLFMPNLAVKVMDGTKTQTRRINKDCGYTVDVDNPKRILEVIYANGRIRYAVGKTYAVCPGRTKKSIGRIMITEIRREDVRNITYEDALAEGMDDTYLIPVTEFMWTWAGMHDKVGLGYLQDLDILVPERRKVAWDYLFSRPKKLYDAWVLTFEVVKREAAE